MMVSQCCGALAHVGGTTTHFYVCQDCGKPCDLVDERDFEQQRRKKMDPDEHAWRERRAEQRGEVR